MILRPGKFIDARKSGGPEASSCGYPDASDSDMPSAPLWGVAPTIHLGPVSAGLFVSFGQHPNSATHPTVARAPRAACRAGYARRSLPRPCRAPCRSGGCCFLPTLNRSANRSQRRRDLRLRAGGSRTTNHGFAQARYCLASRAHHAFFLTARFPGDGQEARNWRAFAAAFRSPRTAFLARMRFGRFVSGRRNPVSPMQIDLGQLAGFDVSPRSTDKAQCSLSPGSPTRARGC